MQPEALKVPRDAFQNYCIADTKTGWRERELGVEKQGCRKRQTSIAKDEGAVLEVLHEHKKLHNTTVRVIRPLKFIRLLILKGLQRRIHLQSHCKRNCQ